ncbi:aldo/keto reductase [Amycolatopsis sp. NPDC058340]|uniref:aldo/keto reductase n=1 Tax=Amycolatopsis sp. NPDC058340 TaxID=3346453 RepID=UPI00364A47A1
MITRTTRGSSGLTVSAMGLGCMGMSESYGAADWDGGVATIDRALELGITFLDTADAYGTGHNEVLLGRVVHGRRDEVQVAAKFASTAARAQAL